MTIWRQRQLERAETAAIALERRQSEIVEQLRRLHDYSERDGITEDSVAPYDEEHAQWRLAVVDEISSLAERSLTEVQQSAPLVRAQIQRDAADDAETPEAYFGELDGGLDGYLIELSRWCRREISAANKRPRLLQLAGQLRDRNFVLPFAQLEVMACYQTTLDNQLYKALHALRESQECLVKTMGSSQEPIATGALVIEAEWPWVRLAKEGTERSRHLSR